MEEFAAVQTLTKKGFRLDPRTKVLFMAFVTTLMFFVYQDIIFVSVLAFIPFLFLLLNKQRKTAFIYGGLFILAIAAKGIQDSVELTQAANAVLVLLLALVMRLFPTFMMGYYVIESTRVGEFISAMERWHVSQKLIIPITVVFRFIPTIQEEYRFIKEAMRMRKIQLGTKKFFKNPGVFLEYRIIPLMISVAIIGEELSAAALTRGLGDPVKRTNIAVIGFGFYDMLILVVAVVLMIWIFV